MKPPDDLYSPSPPPQMERCHSPHLSVSSSCGSGNLQKMCRICQSEEGMNFTLISPCYCSGSMRYVHESCLQMWIKSSDTRCCELCKFNFIMYKKIKPFREWEKLDMSPVEQREMRCSICFLVFTIPCVIWSLYGLIKRIAVEMQTSVLEWWTKLIFDAIGFTCGLFLMYVHCKVCGQLFRRWRAFNSIIYVQNVPDKEEMMHLQEQAVVYSVAAQSNTSVLTSEEAKPLNTLDEDSTMYYSCQSFSISNSSSHSGSSNSINFYDANNIAGEIPTAETYSTKTPLTSIKDGALVPVVDHNHPLSDVIVISTTIDTVSSSSE